MSGEPYQVVIGKDEPKKFKSFEEAFPYLYKQICRYIDERSINRATVEYDTYMQEPSGKKHSYRNACEEAIKRGLFKNGNLVEKPNGITTAGSNGTAAGAL
jgi:hypothetical protein